MKKNNTEQPHSGWGSKTGAADVSIHSFVFQLLCSGSRQMLKQMAKGWGEDVEKRNVLQLWLFCGATAATSVWGCRGRSGGIVMWLASVKQVSSKTSGWHVIRTCPPTSVRSGVKVTSNSNSIPIDHIPVQTVSSIFFKCNLRLTRHVAPIRIRCNFSITLESQTKT